MATNRIVPSIDDEGPFTVGRWKAVTDDQIDDASPTTSAASGSMSSSTANTVSG